MIKIKKVEDNAMDAQHAVKREYIKRVEDMAAILQEKEAAFKIMQQDFAIIKEFRV
jgi:hypothetical protein